MTLFVFFYVPVRPALMNKDEDEDPRFIRVKVEVVM